MVSRLTLPYTRDTVYMNPLIDWRAAAFPLMTSGDAQLTEVWYIKRTKSGNDMKPLTGLAATFATALLLLGCESSSIYPPKAHVMPDGGYTMPAGYPIPRNDLKVASVTATPATVSATPAYLPKEIEVLSDPPGARIEVNDDYVGDAPLNVKVAEVNGTFSTATVIKALPTVGGDWTQSKYFESGHVVPSRILFQMDLGQPTPAVDLNVHQSN
jgi:hypothetical protein